MRFETTLLASLALLMLASPVVAAERNKAKAATAPVVTAPPVMNKAERAEQESTLAAQAYKAGDYPAAVIHFRNAIKFDAHNAMTWHFLGQSLTKTGDLAEAQRAYDQVLQLQPDSEVANRTREALVKLSIVKEIADAMVTIPAGSFMMGSMEGKYKFGPVHQVTFRQPFAMSKFEVTQGQWKSIMGNNPSEFASCGDNCPVEHISWDSVQDFIRQLSLQTGRSYRLPSEAEWEYAARAGSTTQFPWGDQASHEYANYGNDNIDGFAQGRDQWINTARVGSFPPNAFGLYDMIGNVDERVQDNPYHSFDTFHVDEGDSADYEGAPTDGRVWNDASSSKCRIYRGGGGVRRLNY